MLQNIANHNGNNRVAGSAGFEQSAQYVDAWLAYSGHQPTSQSGSFRPLSLQTNSSTVNLHLYQEITVKEL
jgi:hypothetical protein